MLTKLGISTAPLLIKAPRRTIDPGTARKPAPLKRFSPQPANFDGTLSHQVAPPAPPSMISMSLRRNDSSTAFFNHWLRSEEHTSELQSLMRISYAVFCLKKKTKRQKTNPKQSS